jgi:hypothetical protein
VTGEVQTPMGIKDARHSKKLPVADVTERENPDKT